MRKDYVKKVDEFNSKYYVNYIYEDISDNLDPSHMGVPIAGLNSLEAANERRGV